MFQERYVKRYDHCNHCSRPVCLKKVFLSFFLLPVAVGEGLFILI